MRRDLVSLAAAPVDLLIIGGGAYGACASAEAARRGLSVGLVEKGDFGAATSGNSLQTMHGGLRYLQQLDLVRMRESIRERRHWLQFAPDLVSPLPFLLPTYGWGLRGPPVMATALALNDLISADRNRGVCAEARLPHGGQLSRRAAQERFSKLRLNGHNGAAQWFDGFTSSPGTLLIRILQQAVSAGARAVNYCAAEELLLETGRVAGALVRDALTGAAHPIRARCVLNAAGPWVDAVAAMAGRSTHEPLFHSSKAMNLVVRRIPLDDAIGIPIPRRSADADAVLDKGTLTYFVMPWGRYSLIGTKHLQHVGNVDAMRVEAAQVQELLDEINPALGPWRLKPTDVLAVKCGLLPAQGVQRADEEVLLQKHVRIVDHERDDGISGLVSVVGVKWTTARLVAEQAVEQICRKLDRPHRAPPALAATVTPESAVGAGIQLAPDSRVTEAQINAAAQEEMAVTLSDAVMRRTDLWLSSQLDTIVLRRAAELMAPHLGWSGADVNAQVASTCRDLQAMQAWRGSTSP